MAIVGGGAQLGVGKVGITATTRDDAHGGVVARSCDGIDIDGEIGHEDRVLRYNDRAGVGCNAVVPSGKMVPSKGCGRDNDGILVVIGAAAAYRAHGRVVVSDGNVGDVGVENGGEHGVLNGIEVARIVGVAVAPALEVIVGKGCRGENYRSIVAVESRTGDSATGGVVARDGDIGVVRGKDGGESTVGVDYQCAGIGAVAIIPTDEVVVGVGKGLDAGDGAAASGLLRHRSGTHKAVVH